MSPGDGPRERGQGRNLPPMNNIADESDRGETTGRYIIIFRDDVVNNPKLALKTMENRAGISHTAVSADYGESAVSADELANNESTYFSSLGIAVVSGENASLQTLEMSASDSDSNILAIEPEYRAYSLDGTTVAGTGT